MKKWIMATALIVGLSGFAAAQTTPTKTAKKAPLKKEVKKGEARKDDKTVRKETIDSNTAKLPMPVFPPDTTTVPAKKEQ